jgi:predicted kinase
MRAPELFVFFGMIATGKSTLAERWAASRGIAYYNSDRVRKELAGMQAETRQREEFDEGIYTADFSRKTYDELLRRAEIELSAGRNAVLDGSYQARSERMRLVELAEKHAAAIRFIFCHCPEEEMRRRMGKRALDAGAVSDGRWEIYQLQKKRFEPPEELEAEQLVSLNTDDSLENLLQTLDSLLNH